MAAVARTMYPGGRGTAAQCKGEMGRQMRRWRPPPRLYGIGSFLGQISQTSDHTLRNTPFSWTAKDTALIHCKWQLTCSVSFTSKLLSWFVQNLMLNIEYKRYAIYFGKNSLTKGLFLNGYRLNFYPIFKAVHCVCRWHSQFSVNAAHLALGSTCLVKWVPSLSERIIAPL